jgi:hypothetical protein
MCLAFHHTLIIASIDTQVKDNGTKFEKHDPPMDGARILGFFQIEGKRPKSSYYPKNIGRCPVVPSTVISSPLGGCPKDSHPFQHAVWVGVWVLPGTCSHWGSYHRVIEKHTQAYVRHHSQQAMQPCSRSGPTYRYPICICKYACVCISRISRGASQTRGPTLPQAG